MLTITRIFQFETAHAIHHYDGACCNIHGHRYQLQVTVQRAKDFPYSEEQKMIMDFKELKDIVEENIVKNYDHALLVTQAYFDEEMKGTYSGKIEITSYEPTAENILMDIKSVLEKSLPFNVKLHSLRLYETEKNYIEWHN